MSDNQKNGVGRREFLGTMAMGTAAMLADPTRVLGANDRVRVGMIGCGARGQELLQQVLKVPNAEVVAIADIYPRRFDEPRKLVPGVRTVNDHRRLLEMKDVDAVLVASPLHIHARHFLDTVAAGKDLYCEKTMTWSMGEAEQCLAAAQKSKQVVGVGLQWTSYGSLADARQWVKQGAVGKVAQVDTWMSRNTPAAKASGSALFPATARPRT